MWESTIVMQTTYVRLLWSVEHLLIRQPASCRVLNQMPSLNHREIVGFGQSIICQTWNLIRNFCYFINFIDPWKRLSVMFDCAFYYRFLPLFNNDVLSLRIRITYYNWTLTCYFFFHIWLWNKQKPFFISRKWQVSIMVLQYIIENISTNLNTIFLSS